MSNILKKSIICTIGMMACMLILSVCYGASIDLTVGYRIITVGGSTTLNIRGNNAVGKVSITSSNPNVVSVSSSSQWIDPSASVTLTTKSVGTATITVSSVDMADSSTGGSFSGSNSVTITVNPVYIDTRSTNNKLSALGISGYNLNEEFNDELLDYTATIPYDVEAVEITASAADNSASIQIEGNTGLQYGENTVLLNVTAEKGDKRTYKIVVNREKNPDDINAYLSSLSIENATLKDIFNKEKYTYTCEDLSGDIESLNIIATAEIPEATIEIIGNESLEVGTNTITIKVVSKDGSTQNEYNIVLYKSAEILSLKDIEENVDESSKLFSKKNIKYIILIALAIIEFIIILILIFKRRNYSDVKERKNIKYESYDNEEIDSSNNSDINEDITLEDTNLTEEALKFNDINEITTRRHRRN